MQSEFKSGVIFDSHFLAHKYGNVNKHLSYDGEPTGVVYGFLSAITEIRERMPYHSHWFGFAFEGSQLLRSENFPEYKTNRIEGTPEQKETQDNILKQIHKLREDILPDLGFKNIWTQEGEEADDIIAMVAYEFQQYVKGGDQLLTIISRDKDLYQALGPNVEIMPGVDNSNSYTLDDFKKEYRIPLHRWVFVKAIAGDISDNVPGLKGIGIKTALKYYRDELKETSKAFEALQDPENRKIVRRNLELMRLPSETVTMPKVFYEEDHALIKEKWPEVCARFGIKTLDYE